VNYHVTNLRTGLLIGSFPSRRRLLVVSREIFGETIGLVRSSNIIIYNGIIHCITGTFLISVTGVQTWFGEDKNLDANFCIFTGKPSTLNNPIVILEIVPAVFEVCWNNAIGSLQLDPILFLLLGL
jgi:hypothetical protein